MTYGLARLHHEVELVLGKELLWECGTMALRDGGTWWTVSFQDENEEDWALEGADPERLVERLKQLRQWQLWPGTI